MPYETETRRQPHRPYHSEGGRLPRIVPKLHSAQPVMHPALFSGVNIVQAQKTCQDGSGRHASVRRPTQSANLFFTNTLFVAPWGRGPLYAYGTL